jgi:branched-chain amino acid transport system permease protein
VFDVLYSVKPIVMALMGGLGSPLGMLIGAFLYLGLEELVWRHISRSTAACSGFLS